MNGRSSQVPCRQACVALTYTSNEAASPGGAGPGLTRVKVIGLVPMLADDCVPILDMKADTYRTGPGCKGPRRCVTSPRFTAAQYPDACVVHPSTGLPVPTCRNLPSLLMGEFRRRNNPGRALSVPDRHPPFVWPVDLQTGNRARIRLNLSGCSGSAFRI